MTSQADFIRPPRIATWLIKLFASAEEQAILGDLVEEYSDLALKSNLTFARRWYWRQAMKTIAHLSSNGFRGAPWSTAAVVIAGFVLHRFVSKLPDVILLAVTDRYLLFWSNHFKAYSLMLNGMPIEHIVGSIFVGCVIALASKGREMIVTMTLALVLSMLICTAIVWVATHRGMDVAWLLWSSAEPIAIVVGGAIVRTHRLAATSRPSNA